VGPRAVSATTAPAVVALAGMCYWVTVDAVKQQRRKEELVKQQDK
jgi:hypothetical protein